MSYRYTIIQENTNNKTKLTYEFAANDENEMVEEFNSFMVSIGFAQSGYLSLVDDNDVGLYDDIDSEVQESYDWKNPEIESYKNFEFPLHKEGQGQTEYTFVSSDADSIAEKSKQLHSTWPFPLDRPSEQTYRVDSIYDTNNEDKTYYGV